MSYIRLKDLFQIKKNDVPLYFPCRGREGLEGVCHRNYVLDLLRPNDDGKQ